MTDEYQNTMKELCKIIANGADLNITQAKTAFEIMMSGDGNPAQLGAFLMGLHVKGENIDEIVGAATIMRQKLTPIKAPNNAMDVVGTGGDMLGTLNVSTAVAFVMAGAGVIIAKHGNRAITSKSGTADVQSALGINVAASINIVQKCLDEAGICFMFAPNHHTAMKNIMPIRSVLGHKTIYNILGPLTNPAFVEYALIGAYDIRWLRPMAQAAMRMGMKRAWYCHGEDGIDELSITGISHVIEIANGIILEREVHPSEAKIATFPIDAIKGGDANYNAQKIRELLNGEDSAFRAVVLFNAAAGFMINGMARDWQDGVAIAKKSLDSGAALEKLRLCAQITNEQ